MTAFARHPSSFRDPSGYVFTDGQRFIRGLGSKGVAEFSAARASGLLDAACSQGLLIPSHAVADEALRAIPPGARGETAVQFLEHPRIPVISYPYEWTFEQLRDAALQHLRLQLLALSFDFELSDATAYNMQFADGLPLHIDVLSLRRYSDGRPWEGYNQFCRQFLFPLLLESVAGIPFQRWYRGNLNGLELDHIKGLIPAWRRCTSLNLLMHVQLQANAVRRASSNELSGAELRLPHIPRSRYKALLEGLLDWISSMESGRRKTYWADYATVNSYSASEKGEKHAFVERVVAQWGAETLLDVGGNSGDYSEAALAGGARTAICVDGDVDALEIAYRKRKNGRTGLLPLVMDWSDPSPGQGWAGRERLPLDQRLQADVVMALAVVHHIVIGGNVPLREFAQQLFRHGDRIIVEFVPKSDPMVQGLLRGREDIFDEYTEQNFVDILTEYATILEVVRLREDGRVLFTCQKH